jgi:hypothetical protein
MVPMLLVVALVAGTVAIWRVGIARQSPDLRWLSVRHGGPADSWAEGRSRIRAAVQRERSSASASVSLTRMPSRRRSSPA